MAIKHAALKQLRKDRRRQQRNQMVRSELKTLTKRFVALVSAKRTDDARTLLHSLTSKYDRAASKGVIHRNTAARYKSRLSKRLATL
jgi:small subunit ribosomal protein S20